MPSTFVLWFLLSTSTMYLFSVALCCVLVYCTCWVCHKSCMCNFLSLSTLHCQNVYTWNTALNSLHFKLCYHKWKGVDSDRHFACYWHIWNSTEQNRHFIELRYLKWKEVDRDRALHILGLNWTADLSWHSWPNTVLWLVGYSLKLCSDSLVNI